MENALQVKSLTHLNEGAWKYGSVGAGRSATTLLAAHDVAEPEKNQTLSGSDDVAEIQPAAAGGRSALPEAVTAPDSAERG